MFGWLKTAVSRFRNSGISNPSRWLVDSLTFRSDSGVSVTPTTAIGYAPVWYAVNKIAGHVGQLPLSVMQRSPDGGAEMAKDHATYPLLKQRPNRYQTAIQFKEQLMAHALLWGNGRAAIVRDRHHRILELIPLPPDRTVTVMESGEKFHCVTLDPDDRVTRLGGTRSGEMAGRIYKLPDEDVLHISGLGFDGVTGLSLISVARNVFGVGVGAERAVSKSFSNGSRPDIVIEDSNDVFRDEKDAKEFLDSWNNYHKGLDNAGKAGLLRGGLTAKPLSMSASDAEWVEQRRFQRQETALLFLLESILGDDSSVSYNSLEQKNLAYLSNCLMRWLVKWEQECDTKLRSRKEQSQDNYFFKFNVAALLRADYKTTVAALSQAISARIINPNEARDKLDLNPYDGGDEYANPAITPGEPGEDGAITTDVDIEDVNRSAIMSHLRHMIEVEAKHVLNAAGNKRNYIGWLDQFYGGQWLKTFTRAVSEMDGTDDLASSHCEQSKEEIMEIAGTVTPDGLADAVSEVVERWPDRAEALAHRILKGELTNV